MTWAQECFCFVKTSETRWKYLGGAGLVRPNFCLKITNAIFCRAFWNASIKKENTKYNEIIDSILAINRYLMHSSMLNGRHCNTDRFGENLLPYTIYRIKHVNESRMT